MKKYNFMRPLLIIAVALLAKNLTTSICMMFGIAEEPASNFGFMAMMLAAILTFMKLNNSRKRK